MAASIKQQRKAALADPAAANTVLVKDKRTNASGKSRAKWVVSSDFAPAFDAVALVDLVSSAILEAHYLAVSKGLRADGSGAQPALDAGGEQGRLAREGKRPNLRGVTGSTRPLADYLTRKKITIAKKPVKLNSGVMGTSARTTVEPAPMHKRYVQLEADGDKADGGAEYFYTEGAIDQMIDRIVAEWTDVAIDGGTTRSSTAETTAAQQT